MFYMMKSFPAANPSMVVHSFENKMIKCLSTAQTKSYMIWYLPTLAAQFPKYIQGNISPGCLRGENLFCRHRNSECAANSVQLQVSLSTPTFQRRNDPEKASG